MKENVRLRKRGYQIDLKEIYRKEIENKTCMITATEPKHLSHNKTPLMQNMLVQNTFILSINVNLDTKFMHIINPLFNTI